MAGDPSSLSARAQEILRRADAQLDALKAPAKPLPTPPEPEEELRERDPAKPAEVQDLGALVDTVAAGVEAAATHLVALSEAVERIAQEIEEANELHRRTLPPQLEGHARLPEAGAQAPAAQEPTASEGEGSDPLPVHDAAHDAARLVAIEMAVAGDTREGVGRRLRDEFGIRDPRSILDDAFGPEPGPAGRTGYGT